MQYCILEYYENSIFMSLIGIFIITIYLNIFSSLLCAKLKILPGVQ